MLASVRFHEPVSDSLVASHHAHQLARNRMGVAEYSRNIIVSGQGYEMKMLDPSPTRESVVSSLKDADFVILVCVSSLY